MPAGIFITFEGPEGSGKTTQMAGLAARLRAAGHDVLTTREPGGTPAGERIRGVLLDPAGGPLHATTEAFLFNAARSELVETVIRPALAAGQVVLCDRYDDATLAYQGYGRGVDLDLLRTLNRLATGGLVPDITLLFDLPVELGLTRRQADLFGEGVNRLDAEGLAFHRRVLAGYHRLAEAERERWHVVDAAAPVAGVAEAVWGVIGRQLAT